MAEVLHVTENNFEEVVLKSELPVFVDFWASWCGPCRSMEPVVVELAKKYDGKVRFCKVNVDENLALAQRYRVMSIPAIHIFKDGESLENRVGAGPAPEYFDMIEGAL
ncbi:MAG: thioredoxin [Christensenellaceae bacterium]|jgi:thioredoxin 1|nr:thioredoxin [Christensenellaceae bacterium]